MILRKRETSRNHTQRVKSKRKEENLTKTSIGVSRFDESRFPANVEESDKYLGIAGANS